VERKNPLSNNTGQTKGCGEGAKIGRQITKKAGAGIMLKSLFHGVIKNVDKFHIMRIMKDMLRFMLKELAKPARRRLGTMMAGTLVGMGFAQEQAVEVQQAITAAMLVIIDLILSYMERNNASD
jgi:hypothetical protein